MGDLCDEYTLIDAFMPWNTDEEETGYWPEEIALGLSDYD